MEIRAGTIRAAVFNRMAGRALGLEGPLARGRIGRSEKGAKVVDFLLGFAAAAPQLERTMAELQVTLREASEALDQFEQVTASTDRILNQEGEAIAKDLRSTLKSASGAAKPATGRSPARPRSDSRSSTAHPAPPVRQS